VGDLFCGSAVVARLFKEMGYRVIANDNLWFCSRLAASVLRINREPTFAHASALIPGTLIQKALFDNPYDLVMEFLNNLPGIEGFIFREYSPDGTNGGAAPRRYFTRSNAMRIDGIRKEIANWAKEGRIDSDEASLLVACLLHAANRVANIAGTYGAFIKRWDPRALRDLRLKRLPIVESELEHEVLCMDANQLVQQRSFDILYLDPPYTWRHYGAYYHLLETIALGDEPQVAGKTGIRPWEQNKSRYCSRTDAPVALRELIASANSSHIFLSYNTEGLISHDQIMEILSLRGHPLYYETAYRRYRSNKPPDHNKPLKERLYYVKTS
jgi:adenine-specific DNA-methyltransferase